MSKTHKITQLKKRIAELEKKLNRYESPKTMSVNVIPLVVEHPVRYEEYERFHKQKAYQESLERAIARAFVNSEVFRDNITTQVNLPHDSFMPVTIRAAIMIAPYPDCFIEK